MAASEILTPWPCSPPSPTSTRPSSTFCVALRHPARPLRLPSTHPSATTWADSTFSRICASSWVPSWPLPPALVAVLTPVPHPPLPQVSLELLAQEETYLPYVLGLAPHCATVKHVRAGGVGSEGVWEQPRPCPPVQFCETEVEAVHRDADQVQVVALTAALKVRQSRGWRGAALAPFLAPPKSTTG